jgi:predicted TIM-barrel enzyme
MNRFLKLFGAGKPETWNKRVVLPVIHVKHGEEFETAYAGVRTALEAGADGAFLIEMSCRTDHGQMTQVAHDIRQVLEGEDINFPVGINYLNIAREADIPIYEAVRLGTIPMLWSDNPYGRQNVEGARAKVAWNDGVYFGAVAFKYQDEVNLIDLPRVAQEARWMDVLTTSGEGTGKAIDTRKAEVFAEAVPDAIRGVASGVSAENVHEILPYVHAILVASSIASGYNSIDPARTKELVDIVHSWTP